MRDSKKIKAGSFHWEHYVWGVPLLWTLVIVTSLVWNVIHTKQMILEEARIQARVAFEKDIIYRHWNTKHGGVYVPVTKETQPNPYLSHLPERDITTPSGKLLTLMNPAYMTRQVHELAKEKYRILGHITSLNPIRSENAPDPWEINALQAFGRGETEINSVEKMEGKDYMRLMLPLITEKACLKCHAAQGYREGDIRGGISVSTPMEPLWTIERKSIQMFALVHILIWLVGLGGIGLAAIWLKKSEQERKRAEEQLQKAYAELEQRVEERTVELRTINESLQKEITERKRAEEELRLDESRMEALLKLNQMADALLQEIMDFALEEITRLTGSEIGYLAFVNEDETVLTMHAWSKSAMEKCRINDKPLLYPIETTGLWGEAVRQRRPVITNDYQAPNPLKKGYPEGHVEVTRHMNVPIFDGEHIVIVAGVGNKACNYDESDVRQLTLLMTGMWRIIQRKRAEEENASLQEQLRQSQKIEAIGQLAGGIAHDFNNLLTVIKGYSELSLIKLKEGDPLKGNIQEIHRASQRAADLTRQLLAFSRRQILAFKILDLNTILQDLDKMLRRVIGEDIELVTHLVEGLGRVKTDPGQIEQMVINLAVNARDAMSSGGKLTIETANVELDKAYARSHLAVIPGHYVMLSVSDTGVGMSPEIRERIFEPFFTTKEKDKGTGLGLSTVYGIVKQSGGNIWVYSEPGQGTTFKIYLPREEEPLEEIREKVVKGELPRGSETVLVVEDEPSVRNLASHILRDHGYTVLEAAKGNEAIQIATDSNGKIDLLLTDVVMPQMGGKELAQQLKTLRPNIKVLFTSGYTDNTIVHHGVLEPGTNFLQKPFSLVALAQKVREVLDK